jgi:arylsulfatase
LFHTDIDRSEARDLAAEHPDKLKVLTDLWLSEAKKNNALPLIDLGVRAMHEAEYHAPRRDRYVYYPNTTEVPEAAAARTLGVSFKMLAEVEFTGDSQGVIVAQGSRFGGYSLFVKGGKLFYVYNFLGIPPEQRLVCNAPKLGKHVVGVEFVKERISELGEAFGQMTLYVDEEVAAQAPFRTQTGRYILCGEGLCVGYDGGDAVSSEYKPQFPFTGGRVVKVVFDIADDVYIDVERKLAAAMARD